MKKNLNKKVLPKTMTIESVTERLNSISLGCDPNSKTYSDLSQLVFELHLQLSHERAKENCR